MLLSRYHIVSSYAIYNNFTGITKRDFLGVIWFVCFIFEIVVLLSVLCALFDLLCLFKKKIEVSIFNMKHKYYTLIPLYAVLLNKTGERISLTIMVILLGL